MSYLIIVGLFGRGLRYFHSGKEAEPLTLVLLTALGVGGPTIIGSLIGFVFKKISHKFSDIVLSFAAGVMLAAAVLGLIIPSIDYGGKYGLIITITGIFAGALCLNLIDKLVPHLHKLVGSEVSRFRTFPKAW